MSNIDRTEKATFFTFTLLTFVIIVASLIIFMLTPSPISPTKKLFGYIRGINIKNNVAYLVFDQAEWYEDKADKLDASKACAKDNNCNECTQPITKSCIRDGYYIRNPETLTKDIKIASFAKVSTLLLDEKWTPDSATNSSPYRTIKLSELEQIYRSPTSNSAWITSAPYFITTINGWTVLISQHYIP